MPAFASVAPELATLVDDVPTQGEWLHEIKYDGYRIVAYKNGSDVRLASRNGKDWTTQFPEIARALSRLRAKTAVIDGEVAYVREDGRTDFQSLQNAMKSRAKDRIVYYVFDVVHLDGVDLSAQPLRARKEVLRALFAGEKAPLHFGDHATKDGRALFAEACRAGLEGIMCKRADSPYRGGRGKDWVKVKCAKRQEAVVVGFTPPKGSRTGLGALLLAVHDDDGGYRYAGKVGTGFTQASLVDLRKRLGKIVADEPTVRDPPRMRDVTWVKPELVAQVRFSEWTRDGSMRHPSFEGLREDKPPARVVREIASKRR
jgi:bifunctional non-homologous end joining protein LigD